VSDGENLALRYEELISPIIFVCQKLLRSKDKLVKKNRDLESRLNDYENVLYRLDDLEK
jgi:hypothetical protein